MHQQTVYHMTKILVSLYKNQLNLKGLVHAMRSNSPLHQVVLVGEGGAYCSYRRVRAVQHCLFIISIADQ